jgi:uncharacterized protein DUF1688
MKPETVAALSLLSAEAVRRRAQYMLALGLEDELPNFRLHLSRLDAAVDLVLATMRKAYPTLAVPLHSRWRHFVVRGEDRFRAIEQSVCWPDRAARARMAFDLVMISVLLDAGAQEQWRYRDGSGAIIGRSEGLALASLDMFARGVFSANPTDFLRADGTVLAQLSVEQLREGFQVTDENSLGGVEGRVALLRRLGKLVADNPGVFGRNDTPRPGGLFDHLAAFAENGKITAPAILSELLYQLGPIWPSRIMLGGLALGDCWRHPAITTADATSGLVPLHKLSQWLTYSLIQPLHQAGFTVTDIDGLTGLAEYRNGGLFVDTGVLTLRDPDQAARQHDVGAPVVVEWRALTVALLDRLAAALRQKVKMDASTLPLAKILEGGTWAAGRAIARERRANGAPPIKVTSNGTVF